MKLNKILIALAITLLPVQSVAHDSERETLFACINLKGTIIGYPDTPWPDLPMARWLKEDNIRGHGMYSAGGNTEVLSCVYDLGKVAGHKIYVHAYDMPDGVVLDAFQSIDSVKLD